MRPLRLLFSLSACIIAITLLLHLGFASEEQRVAAAPGTKKKGKIGALFSWSGALSFFPPTAIISLTDDNSTFFLARSAAFGPLLPSAGLSGQLWIGSGFGEDSFGRGLAGAAEGELGCSDVPDWNDGDRDGTSGSRLSPNHKQKAVKGSPLDNQDVDSKLDSRGLKDDGGSSGKNYDAGSDRPTEDDGTDDYLYGNSPGSAPQKASKAGSGSRVKAAEHADIQSLQEGAEIAGKIVLLSRGGCGFLEKVKWVQRRGGVALIVGDDVRGGSLITMYARGDTSNVTIPAIFTSHTTAHLLSSLIPPGGFFKTGPSGSARMPGSAASGGGNPTKASEKQSDDRPNFTHKPKSTSTSRITGKRPSSNSGSNSGIKGTSGATEKHGLIHRLLSWFGLTSLSSSSSRGDSRRPPSSGGIEWVEENWDDEIDDGRRRPGSGRLQGAVEKAKPTTSRPGDDFEIGVQDWRDPDLLPQRTETPTRAATDKKSGKTSKESPKSDRILPGSGEYEKPGSGRHQFSSGLGDAGDESARDDDGWLSRLRWGDSSGEKSDALPTKKEEEDGVEGNPAGTLKGSGVDAEILEEHEGLWVTLTPNNMSASPLFDTLLVLVVSPLVTLTVVYALLLLRSRIRRRRWRAPKSVVERLPVRTYHTISNDGSSPTSSLSNSIISPTTPLLQPGTRSHSRGNLGRPRPRSRTASEIPAQTSSRFGEADIGSLSGTPSDQEQEKREQGLAAWRRRYGGRQRECVICLEEYADGVSRVMSLPCGHEFHAECITPWLVTRRRTCPICKGDVVRSLARSNAANSSSSSTTNSASSSPTRSPSHAYPHLSASANLDAVQSQAAIARNDSPSAALPVPHPRSRASRGLLDRDVESGAGSGSSGFSWGSDEDEDVEDHGFGDRRQGSPSRQRQDRHRRRGARATASSAPVEGLSRMFWGSLEALGWAGAAGGPNGGNSGGAGRGRQRDRRRRERRERLMGGDEEVVDRDR